MRAYKDIKTGKKESKREHTLEQRYGHARGEQIAKTKPAQASGRKGSR